MSKVTLFWMRRDLRLYDNAALYESLKSSSQVLTVFIFDSAILKRLHDIDDARVSFIYDQLAELKTVLQKKYQSDLEIRHGDVISVFKTLLHDFQVSEVFTNHDDEPMAIERDQKVLSLLKTMGIELRTFKDQTVFERNEITADSGKNYTIYTPYKKKWLASLTDFYLKKYPVENYTKSFAHIKTPSKMPTLESLGFQRSKIKIPPLEVSDKVLKDYHKTRDFPALENGTSRLGCHLRFGTISIRELATEARKLNDTYLSELIWRDFFMQILFHYPRVVNQSFRPEYDKIAWRKNQSDFDRWCNGETGYPIVDAGMRELNATGHMHNRVRMIVASFLTKHLLIHWYEGERYFARKLLDYDLSANNGNWQWAAGTGCDAAPYFRIFNPYTQTEKFDPEMRYVKSWVPELNTAKYPPPIVDHAQARERCLTEFKKGLGKSSPSS
jgi:deoxyribodipyrimidine photo-lyase